MEKPLGSRYRLGEQLGAGAMGRVFTVSDEGGARYAAKVLRDELAEDQNLVARFLQERSILVGLRHPNLVAVHDLVVEGDTVAIVMDLVSGGDLRRKLAAAGTLLP
ncbi:protein kinase, partial [Kutzneria sp. 744]|uniref:protein kinase domain-containing protein n=1 Tax=Kutzneria sp. (strain 744) TaxID=345341 RepID=UPI0003EEBB5F